MPPTKIQYGRQAAILKVTSLEINKLVSIATINMHMKFEIEIPKQTKVTVRKPSRLQTDRRTSVESLSCVMKPCATQSWLLSSSCFSVVVSSSVFFFFINPNKNHHQSQITNTTTILSEEPHILVSGPYSSDECHYRMM